MLLEVPHFATSVYKSTKHFDFSFAYDAPKFWNDWPDDVRQPLLSTHPEKTHNVSLCKHISTLISAFPGLSPWC